MRYRLGSPTDWPGFERSIRDAIAKGIHANGVQWTLLASATAATASIHEALPISATTATSEGAHPLPRAPHLPGEFARLGRMVILHSDHERFRKLHRFAEQIARDLRAWDDTIDPLRIELEQMAKEVRRDGHKMKAFARFAPEKTQEALSARKYFAWFEPSHHVIRPVGSFFARRFASMRWAIFTPLGRAEWDGKSLHVGPPATRADLPELEDDHSLWLTYYASIFNPGRLKPSMMRKEMPVRYWPNLPEAKLIPQLIAEAQPRVTQMVKQADEERRRCHGGPSTALAAVTRSSTKTSPNNRDRSLHQMSMLMDRCRDCAFAERATQAVPGSGAIGSAIMIVGEQPGDREDLAGKPFVGPAGQLLWKAIRELGWNERRLLITNAVKHFKYELRGKKRIHKTPAQREAEACLSYLESEIALVEPQVIIALGQTALRSLETIRDRRALTIPIVAIEHPAALLRTGRDHGTPGYQAWRTRLGAAGGSLIDHY